jgi:alpha-methylacyl-CoA racemase
VDSAASMMTFLCGLAAQGRWRDARGTNFLDGSSPWYGVYRTADGEFMAVGAIEQPFYEALVRQLGLADEPLPSREDPAGHPELRRRIAEAFLQRSQAEWTSIFAGVEACVTPVLPLSSAPAHDHLASRSTFETAFGHLQPAPAPRFSKTPAEISSAPPEPGQHTEEALRSWGIDRPTVRRLLRSGAIYSFNNPTHP